MNLSLGLFVLWHCCCPPLFTTFRDSSQSLSLGADRSAEAPPLLGLWQPEPRSSQAHSLSSTIGKLEPSYVIRKFLDAQRIHNLTAYLQMLHVQSLANADHTTLLLNCYTKLKDISKLEEFIKVQVRQVGTLALSLAS